MIYRAQLRDEKRITKWIIKTILPKKKIQIVLLFCDFNFFEIHDELNSKLYLFEYISATYIGVVSSNRTEALDINTYKTRVSTHRKPIEIKVHAINSSSYITICNYTSTSTEQYHHYKSNRKNIRYPHIDTILTISMVKSTSINE